MIFNRIRHKATKSLVLAGIMNGRKAYVGPEVVYIDLTNNCNNNCIGCWCRSPLLREKVMPDWEKSQTLSTGVIIKALGEIIAMRNLKQVKLAGGGEPFMHPDMLKIIEYIKSKDSTIEIDINTNFTLVDEKIIEKIVDLKVDSMTVSLWAGDAETYVKTHPNKTMNDFAGIEAMLKLIEERKGGGKPQIKLYNVISKVNHGFIREMLDFALVVKAEAIQFVPLDPIPGYTDTLLLNESETMALLTSCCEIKKGYNGLDSIFTDGKTGRSIAIIEFDNFIRQMNNQMVQRGIYDYSVVNTIPCYVGWLFVRITANGNVVPCNKAHRLAMGNLYDQSFKKIWQSRRYKEFRYYSKSAGKGHPYFALMGNDASKETGCYNCDNLWQNEPMHKLVSSFSSNRRRLWDMFKIDKVIR